MSKIALFYFSGTSNTEYVVKLYYAELIKLGNEVDLCMMEDYLDGKKIMDTNSYGKFGFAYPVHAFNAPRIVFSFLKHLPKGMFEPAFIIKVSGGYSSVNKGSSLYVRNKLLQKGYNVNHESSIVMASNFWMKNTDEEVKKLYKVAKVKAAIYAKEIHEEQKRIVNVPLYNAMISQIAFGEQLGARMLGKFHYYTTKACVLCASCVQACPMCNIRDIDNHIKFGFNCTLCMRCMYQCPKHAIKIRFFNFIQFKDGFDLNKILEKDAVSDSFEKNNNDQFYRKYKKYIDDVQDTSGS
jgi:NAD-dependent dihydropyrimidine dehydrogenase PreA subunit